jgi:putative flippase GtrA
VSVLLGDERVRFVLIGGINTVVGYALYALLYLSAGRFIGYLGALYISYVIAIGIAFVLHRRFTFRVSGTGNVFVDLVRFAAVYVVSLIVNTLLLPVLIELGHVQPLVAQAAIVIVTTLISYFGHKLFSFRRHKATGSEPIAETDPG